MSNVIDLIANKEQGIEKNVDSFNEFEKQEIKQPIVPKRPLKQESQEIISLDSIPKIPQRPKKKEFKEVKEDEQDVNGIVKDIVKDIVKEVTDTPIIPARPKKESKSSTFIPKIPENPKRFVKVDLIEETFSKSINVNFQTKERSEIKSQSQSKPEIESKLLEPIIPSRPVKYSTILQNPQKFQIQEKQKNTLKVDETEVKEVSSTPVIPQRPRRFKTQEKELKVLNNEENNCKEETIITLSSSAKESDKSVPIEKEKDDNLTKIKETSVIIETTIDNESEVSTKNIYEKKSVNKSTSIGPESTCINESLTKPKKDPLINELLDQTSQDSKNLESNLSKPTLNISTSPKKYLSRLSIQDSFNDSNIEKPASITSSKVPKKPSNKIAAFQELLLKNQKIEQEKSKVSKRSESSNPERKTFKANLNNLFALPGMAKPGVIPAAIKTIQITDDEQEEEEEKKKKEPVQSDVRRSRAKGPKGKRLPKAVAEKVEFNDKIATKSFDIESPDNSTSSNVDLNLFKSKTIEKETHQDNTEESLKNEIEKKDSNEVIETEAILDVIKIKNANDKDCIEKNELEILTKHDETECIKSDSKEIIREEENNEIIEPLMIKLADIVENTKPDLDAQKNLETLEDTKEKLNTIQKEDEED